MMDRSVIVHAGIAAVAVALAYAAWTRPAGVAEAGSIELIAGRPEDAVEVRWSDEDAELLVARAGDDVRVSVTNKKAAAGSPPPGGAPGVAAPAPAKTRVYPGSAAARELFGKLVPLRVARDLGPIESDKLAAFGLASGGAKLQLLLRGPEHTLQVGGTTFGAGSTYVRAGDGRVYLARTALFAELKNGGTSLTERGLVTVAREKISRVTLHAGPKTRALVQRHADDSARAFFADASDPEARLGQTSSWLERLLRTRMLDFAEALPPGTPAFEVRLAGERGELGAVRLWAPGAADAAAIVEASGHAAPVTIPKVTAEALLKDVEAVLAETP